MVQASLFTPAKPGLSVSTVTILGEDSQATKNMLHIRHSSHATPFGTALIASTDRGICELHFTDDSATLLKDLERRYPNAAFEEAFLPTHLDAVAAISGTEISGITLHLFGTPFQLRVWEALTSIPSGTTLTYGALAAPLQLPATTARAVGTAVGQNAVAVLIPCHWVVGALGKLTGFRWGLERKNALLRAEQL